MDRPARPRRRRAAREGAELEESALALLTRPAQHQDEPRPTLRGHGSYVFGVFLSACTPSDGTIVYQEIDLVLTRDALLTVRKTPDGAPPYGVTDLRAAVKETDSGGMIVYRLLDEIAERYLDLIDDLDEQIDQLEDRVEELPAAETRARISALRHDLLHVRRTLAPTRDAVRRVVDDVVEVEQGPEVFPHDVEVAFNSVYDKLLRAVDGLDLTRDLLAGVRDYSQAKISNDQNEVMKRLTVIASLLLVPTFIVGLYGQNFRDMPELRWGWGYGWSWALIAVTTVLQLWYFRRKRWIQSGRYPETVPYFICPNCKERTVDIDGKEGFTNQAAACRHCGFGFLFELLDDYYPAPSTGLIACDADTRVLAVGRGIFELSGYDDRELMGRDVVEALGLSGFEADKNPARIATEWGVRRMGEKLSLRTRAGLEKPVTADFFPAYDDDGGLLVALTPRSNGARG